jgi:hypothetical protein
MYDPIGDIHGHADELVQLLDALGYRKSREVYGQPERKVVFLGDFIDRGPQIRQALEIVRPMIEEGKALAVMGNHELNALAFDTEDPDRPGDYLRKRENKNVRQHCQTIQQLKDPELANALAWFRTLPMWLDLDGLRVVHACWDGRAISTIIQVLDGTQEITNAFLHSAFKRKEALFAPVELVLKGREAKLPEGKSFTDNHGQVRTEIRTRWYLSPVNQTYRTYALQAGEINCDLALDESVVKQAVPYPATAKPVFVGHYWLSARRPEILADNVACLDYSVAKGGILCAYRWQGEQRLSNDHFVWVGAKN